MIKEAYDYSDELKQILIRNGRAIELTEKFKTLDTNADRIRFCNGLLKEYDLIPKSGTFTETKSEQKSVEARNVGNHYFVKEKDYVSALEWYNKSLCYAPFGSDSMGIAYANRSAIYLGAGFYNFCLENIELALANDYPEKLKPKLEQRKKECLELMNNNIDSFEKYSKENRNIKLSYAANDKIPFVINGLEYANSPEYGRHVRATHDLYPGDVIIVEKAYSKSLLNSAVYSYCANCLEPKFFNLKPCNKCTMTMYCSEKCETESWQRFHKYECPIISGIFTLFTKIMIITIRTTLIAFTLFKEPEQLMDCIDSINLDTENAFNLDYNNPNEETLFRAVYALATNEASRNIPDMFQRSNLCAIAWHLLKDHTDLPKLLKNEAMENLFLNIMFRFAQAAAVNYHSLSNMSKTNDASVVFEGAYSPKQFGSGSFAMCSLINHSCAPNIVRINGSVNGNHNIVIVNKVIRKGEQLFDNYG